MSHTSEGKLEQPSTAGWSLGDVPGDPSPESVPIRGRSTDESANGSKAVAAAGGPASAEDLADPLPEELTVISGRTSITGPTGAAVTSIELGKLLVGQQLGHFVLEEFIGGGGMGAVFRGTDTLLGRIVAVKVLARQHAEDEETARRFRNEAQSAARLDHENIARVYFVGVDRGWHYLVLEFVDGQNLRDLVDQQGPLPVADVINYTLQVAEALAHASSRDVVHRDIKPSNILVTRDGKTKLVDMGLARLHQVEHSAGDLTASGVTLGTFDYISPEQARDPRAADVRSDLYSLGCAMYYMLCGRPPFPDGTVLQKLLQHQGDEAPDPRQFRPDLPQELADTVRKLLAKNPEQRFQQPRELIGELLLLCERLDISTPGGRPAVWIAPHSSPVRWTEQHLPWLVPLALLLLIVVAVLLFGSPATDFNPPPRPRAAALTGEPQAVVLSPQPAKQIPAAGAGAPSSTAPRGAGRSTSASPLADVDAEKGRAATSVAGGPQDGTSSSTAVDRPSPATGGSGVGFAAPDEAKPTKPAQQVIVAKGVSSERYFTTLADACQQAPSGAVIELKFNGRRDERPITILNRDVTIRAGEGYRPIVHFRPDGSDPVLYSRNMISVRGGSLTLFNVALELELPQTVRSDRWSLCETVLADKVRLERCWLTILNAGDDGSAYHQEVSFFYIKAAPRRDAAMMADSPMTETRTDLELRDCVVRGEAALLSGTALHTASLQWENGLLATTERLVNVRGNSIAISPASPLQIDLEHVTAMMRQGMCMMTASEDERSLPTLRMNCANCILLTDAAPLVQQRGDSSIDEQQKLFSWKGTHNLYDGFAIFWRVEGPRASGVAELDWAAWRNHWGAELEGLERGDSVIFKRLADRQRSIASHTPADYALDDAHSSNAARGAATDGITDIGLKGELLPSLGVRAIAPMPSPQGKDTEAAPTGGAQSEKSQTKPERISPDTDEGDNR